MPLLKSLSLILALALSARAVAAQTPVAVPQAPLVEFEMMTWPEVKKAIETGKTTALVYNGGTEQRGPQNVNGGHNLMAREIVRAIALKLGNALAAPVLPFSPNRASADLPGTIGLSTTAFAMVNEEVAEQLLVSGFKTVILMGDHGGGQAELKAVAEKLEARHGTEGRHVFYVDEVYSKANGDFDEWLKANNYPVGGHAAIPDTSTMLYLGGDRGWVRKDLIASALGDPVLPRGQAPDPGVKRIGNGITGDARKSSAELGKRLFYMKVDAAVAQIQRLTR